MKKQIDYTLFFTILALIIFWMIMISSVSVYSSYRVTSIMAKNWFIDNAYNYFYVLRNIWHVFVSLIVLWVVSKIHYSFFEKHIKKLILFVIFLLFVVLILGMSMKWARWWINIPWIPSIQPTEFLKLILILFFASFFKKYKRYLSDFKQWFVPFIWILSFVCLLVWLQPDFWTIMIIIPVSIFMYLIAWMNIKHFFITWLISSLLVLSVYSAWEYDKTTWKNLNKLWYITQRIDNFLANNKESIKNKTINYQTEQALVAIWSGWFMWLGFWGSIQKFWYLPEVQWDFIYSVVVEELWFIWWTILLFLYLFIWYRWFNIATRVTDLFAKYSAFWISSRILLQAFINIWVNLNIVPLTWITLPFISYWGSSLLTLSIWLAILLNISRYIDTDKKFVRKRTKNIIF